MRILIAALALAVLCWFLWRLFASVVIYKFASYAYRSIHRGSSVENFFGTEAIRHATDLLECSTCGAQWPGALAVQAGTFLPCPICHRKLTVVDSISDPPQANANAL